MKSRTRIRAALVATLGAMALAASTGALAHERGKHEWHGSQPGHGWGHAYPVYSAYPVQPAYRYHAYRPHHVMRERVVFLEPPPVIYARPAYSAPPGIVIGVSLPPLVIRLR